MDNKTELDELQPDRIPRKLSFVIDFSAAGLSLIICAVMLITSAVLEANSPKITITDSPASSFSFRTQTSRNDDGTYTIKKNYDGMLETATFVSIPFVLYVAWSTFGGIKNVRKYRKFTQECSEKGEEHK
ncbi:MAG: hypothetical protein FWD34_03740 [Oscillospiraceae bacterium]|nr:hypothetical protein [Oscillospiraceae bacterium]